MITFLCSDISAHGGAKIANTLTLALHLVCFTYDAVFAGYSSKIRLIANYCLVIFIFLNEWSNNLRFANDMVLLSNNIKELQLMAEELSIESERVGLAMNIAKTKR